MSKLKWSIRGSLERKIPLNLWSKSTANHITKQAKIFVQNASNSKLTPLCGLTSALFRRERVLVANVSFIVTDPT